MAVYLIRFIPKNNGYTFLAHSLDVLRSQFYFFGNQFPY